MKLTYTAVAASLLSILSSSAMAAANVELYGKANISVQSSDAGDGSFTEMKSNASRLGFKGTQALDNGLEVLFQAEFQIDMAGDSAKGDSITDRNQYVGLKGGFGTVLAGNNDSMVKQSQGKVDLFGDLNGDIKNLWKGENRVANSVTYVSPAFNDIKFGLTYAAKDNEDAKTGISASVVYGDAKLKKSNVYAAIAVDSDVKGYDVTRLTVQTKVSGVTLGGIYQTQEKVSDGTELDGLMVSAKYTVSGVDLKAQVQTADVDGGNSPMSYSLGADYKLAKNTKFYAFYTAKDNDSVKKSDESYLGTGIEYKF